MSYYTLLIDKYSNMEVSKIWYCDGAFNKVTAPFSWGSIVDDNGEDIIEKYLNLYKIHRKDLHDDFTMKKVLCPRNNMGIEGPRTIILCHFDGVTHQNNGAELISFLLALRLALSEFLKGMNCEEFPTEIRCDSELLVKWWSRGNVNRKKIPSAKLRYIDECIKLRKIYEEKGGKVVQIKGDKNKADLGYH